MATLETQKLDSIIASRRSLLLGGAALAATAVVGTGMASAAIPSTIGDTDILNFALNLEYLEAQFYTLATEGVTADKAATSPITITSGATTSPVAGGTVTYKPSPAVTFVNASIKAYAFETAAEERKHVNFLKSALSTGAVQQPNIDLLNSFHAVGGAAGVSATFDPFASELNFLLGAFIFEDVGVTAYHGGAAYLSTANLTPALEIHAVEAYHAGLIRATLYAIDQGLTVATGGGVGTAASTATQIANARAMLDGTFGTAPTDAFGLTGQDDFGLNLIQVPLNGTTQTATTIMDAGKVVAGTSLPTYNYYIGFARTLAQVLSVVYGGSSTTPGAFFPNGLNGTIS